MEITFGDKLKKTPGYFFHAGLSKTAYEETLPLCLDTIQTHINLLAIVGITVSTIYVFLGVFGIASRQLMLAYLLLFIASIDMYYINNRPEKKPAKNRIVFNYVVFMTTMIFGVLLGTYFSQPDTQTVTLCCLMAVFPFVVIDIPARYDLAILMTQVIFTIFAVRYKAGYPKILTLDLQNVWTVGMLSCVLNELMSSETFRRLHKQIVEERKKDTDDTSMLLTKDAMRDRVSDKLEDGYKGSLLVINIDHFKDINDFCGYVFGDEVLACMGETISQCIRENDSAGRLGADEFLIFLPDADRQTTQIVADRIREKFNDHLGTLSRKDVSMTFSVGMAEIRKHDDYWSLLDKANLSLRDSRRSRKNTVSFYARKEVSSTAEPDKKKDDWKGISSWGGGSEAGQHDTTW